MQHYYIGLMSGTSVDGVDTALVAISAQGIRLLAARPHPIPADMKARILDLCTAGQVSLIAYGALDRDLGILFADAVNALLAEQNMNPGQIRAIGSHGQTVCHRPYDAAPFTLQIGDANQIAARTGIATVADFRRKDMALGGQGAPLVPAFHQTLFAAAQVSTIVLNIGGIANITVLRPGEAVLGFDTGPGNMLMDHWCREHSGAHYDQDAQLARQGSVNDALLARLLAEPYLALPYPKSTGRELFSPAWLNAHLQGFTLSVADVQRTLLEYSARTIANHIEPLRTGVQPQIFVCGGGARNPLLMERLAALLPHWHIRDTDSQGISSDYLEAMAFAWLAHRFMEQQSGNLPEVTGASRAAILGALYPAG